MRNSSFENDRAHLLHPWAEFPRFAAEGSRMFESAEGVYVSGADGRRFLDGIGGLWCVNIGYGRQEMAQAIGEQALKLPYYNTFTDMSSGPAGDLAGKLAELAPGDLNHVFLTTGGSMSIDTATRLCHYYFQAEGRPNKRLVLAREGAYHGSTYLSASISGIKHNEKRFHMLSGGENPLVHHVSCPNVYRPFEGMTESEFCDALVEELEHKIAQLGADNIACFFAEPIMGAGGVLVAPQGYHKRVLDVCRANDILYASDEVVTAFGRLGHMFASEDVFGIVPDIIVSAKGISSGYVPLGAVIYSDKIHEGIVNAKTGAGAFAHGFTYSGHPVACAAGLKNIEIIQREDICGHVRTTGPYFEERLGELRRHEIVGDVRGSHFMLAVEFVCNRQTKESFGDDVSIGKRVAEKAYNQGVIARNVGDYIILSPPLTITREHIDTIVSTLDTSIAEVSDDLIRDGIWHSKAA